MHYSSVGIFINACEFLLGYIHQSRPTAAKPAIQAMAYHRTCCGLILLLAWDVTGYVQVSGLIMFYLLAFPSLGGTGQLEYLHQRHINKYCAESESSQPEPLLVDTHCIFRFNTLPGPVVDRLFALTFAVKFWNFSENI